MRADGNFEKYFLSQLVLALLKAYKPSLNLRGLLLGGLALYLLFENVNLIDKNNQ